GNGTCVNATLGETSETYAIKLSKLPLADDGVGYKMNLPMVNSARMVFSLKYPVSLPVVKNDLGQIKITDPDGFDPADVNYYTLYDKVEFSYDDSGIWINPTAVDFFSIPIRIENANSQLPASGF